MALSPAVLARGWLHGPGALTPIALSVLLALVFESVMLALRGQEQTRFLGDLSAPLTAVLFALCLPSDAPWWVVTTGSAAAIVLAKHLFGGLGYNLFNPAMVGVALTQLIFPDSFIVGPDVRGWPWVATAYFIGGVFLVWKRIVAWQVPFSVLATIALLVVPRWMASHGATPDPRITTFVTTSILGAFFIATDPVTGCTSPRGRLVFGCGVAALTWVSWRWSDFPVGLPFAVLLMNAMAPRIDLHVRRKVHARVSSGSDPAASKGSAP
jgi:electron transport complex protein RnfD